MTTAPATPLRLLRVELMRAADAEKAARMRAYMKSAMPYHGVPSPVLTVVARAVFRDLPLPTVAVWRRHWWSSGVARASAKSGMRR